MSEVDPHNRKVLRNVLLATLMALLVKFTFFLKLGIIHHAIPLEDPFFPWLFRSTTGAAVAYFGALFCAGFAAFRHTQRSILGGCVGLTLCCGYLLIHQNAYNDMTFLCATWAGLWCVWMASRLHEPAERLHARATWLSHAILSLIFLGGVVGKFTAEYWSGEVFYAIYFEGRDYWIYTLLRANLDPESLRSVATMYSRGVVLLEGLGCFLWVMPSRVASGFAFVMLMGIALSSNLLLFSVVGSLLGLALVGFYSPGTE